jgi:hypothetical protein
MKKSVEKWSIVLVGAWNRRIFTPPWLSKHLGFKNEIEVSFALTPDMPMIFQDGELLRLRVHNDKVVVGMASATDEALTAAETLACNILKKLLHTPLSGVGINFTFIESRPPTELIDSFKLPDHPSLGAEGWEIAKHNYSRSLSKEAQRLNLNMGLNKDEVSMEFNFHAQPRTCDEAVKAIEGKVVGFRNQARDILENIYHLAEDNA